MLWLPVDWVWLPSCRKRRHTLKNMKAERQQRPSGESFCHSDAAAAAAAAAVDRCAEASLKLKLITLISLGLLSLKVLLDYYYCSAASAITATDTKSNTH